MTSARTRDRLVERLRAHGIRSEAVLNQIRNVPRHLFVDEALASRAYEDTALPIGHGQTISQPYVVAKMTEALLDGFDGEKVLEIGTGCGYQTAVLASLVKQFRPGDGWEGWPKYAPYDGIIVAAAAPVVPERLLEQLAPGGRLVMPVGAPGYQELMLVTRERDHFEQKSLGGVSFVPLVQG